MEREILVQTRLYSPDAGESFLTLDDHDSLAVRRSLRLKKGDIVACFNGDGQEYIYGIDESTSSSIQLHMIQQFGNDNDLLPECVVCIAATKGKSKDRMVRDLPPLGVTQIIFYHAERSVCRMKKDQEARLQKIAVEACRQCGRSTIPAIRVHDVSLETMVELGEFESKSLYLFWEGEEKNSIRIENEQEGIVLIFGPEGGFEHEEIEWAKSKKCKFVTLGKRILRAELAVAVGVTLTQYQRGLLG